MTEHKFTDEEVIKVLGCCVEGTSEACHMCTFGISPPYPVCKTMVEKHALDLIKRQKAELEKWQERLDREAKTQYKLCTQIVDIKEARAEAVKEFADRLKAYYRNLDKTAGGLVEYHIDQILKEMTEGNE